MKCLDMYSYMSLGSKAMEETRLGDRIGNWVFLFQEIAGFCSRSTPTPSKYKPLVSLRSGMISTVTMLAGGSVVMVVVVIVVVSIVVVAAVVVGVEVGWDPVVDWVVLVLVVKGVVSR